MQFVHSTAIIGSDVFIDKNVEIGPYTIIEDNVVIKENTTIGPFCHIGIKNIFTGDKTLTIGCGCKIRSHSTIYSSNFISDGLVTGHYVSIRENSKIGIDCQIGSYSELQGDCTLGDYVKMQSNVFVPKGVVINQYGRIGPHVKFTNDPTPPSDTLLRSEIGEFASIGANAILLPGVQIGMHAFVAAHSCVTRNVAARTVVRGVPAKEVGAVEDIRLYASNQPAYPWFQHFSRGYPDKIYIDGLTSWDKSNDE